MSESIKMHDIDPLTIQTTIHEHPIKNLDAVTLSYEELEKQAQYLRDSIVKVNYDTVRGTCGDERYRIGLHSGETKVEARPSVFGGPNIYGLYVAELAGIFNDSNLSPDDRLQKITRDLNNNRVASGGHEHCAAAAGFGMVLTNGAASAELVKAYAQTNMVNYDESLMDKVIDRARRLVEEKTYEGWDGEAALLRVLQDEANEAIERLADEPHRGRTLVRQKRSGYTIDQTRVHQNSDGEDSFEWDDPYADRIENALASSRPDAAKLKELMEHAREFVLVGVALSVPNPELHQIDVS